MEVFTLIGKGGKDCHAQTIGTIAGTGVAGYNGDGIAATIAQLNYPAGLGVDPSGNLYIADMSNACIRKINVSTGLISTIAGIPGNSSGWFTGNGGPATSARFSWYVLGAVAHPSGNIYIADAGSSIICMITISTGIINIIAGVNGLAGSSGDGGAATSAKLNYPVAMALDATGNILYIADCYNHKVRKINIATGIISTVAGTGSAGSTGDGGQAIAAKLNYPVGLAVDATGNVYIGDGVNNKVRKVTIATGIITTFAGTGIAGLSGDGGPATSATLNAPQGLAVDGSGSVFVADMFNHRIRKIESATGIITTVAGSTIGFSGDGGPAMTAKLNGPWSIAIQSDCNLFIADQVNQRIRMVSELPGCLLPVELISFEVERKENINLLKWVTASELNSESFFIERSNDGKYFEEIGSIKAAGSSSTVHEYLFFDKQPGKYLEYYRLKQTDTDGTYAYSKVISIQAVDQASSCFVYTEGGKGFILNCGNSFAGEIQVVSMEGSIVKKISTVFNSEIRIDMDGYASGLYILQINDGRKTQYLKLLNQ